MIKLPSKFKSARWIHTNKWIGIHSICKIVIAWNIFKNSRMFLSLQIHSCCLRPDENHIQELICNVKSYYTQTVLSFEWINWKFFTHHKTNNYLYINNLLHKWYWIIHDLLYQVQEAYQRNFSRKNSVNLRLKANFFKGRGRGGGQK